MRASDTAEIRQLYQKLMDGWNNGDARAFAETFTVDGDLVGFDGHRLKGRTQIEEFHAPLFQKWLKGTRLVGAIESVRFLADHVAVVHAVGSTVMNGKSPARERASIQTLTSVLDGTGWRFAAFQNTRVRPMARSRANTALWLMGDLAWRLLGDCCDEPERKADG